MFVILSCRFQIVEDHRNPPSSQHTGKAFRGNCCLLILIAACVFVKLTAPKMLWRVSSHLQWKQISVTDWLGLLQSELCRENGRISKGLLYTIIKVHENQTNKQTNKQITEVSQGMVSWVHWNVWIVAKGDLEQKQIKLPSEIAGKVILFWRFPLLDNIKESAGNPFLVKEASYSSGCSATPQWRLRKVQYWHFQMKNRHCTMLFTILTCCYSERIMWCTWASSSPVRAVDGHRGRRE